MGPDVITCTLNHGYTRETFEGFVSRPVVIEDNLTMALRPHVVQWQRIPQAISTCRCWSARSFERILVRSAFIDETGWRISTSLGLSRE